jgi:Glycoside-hydrolase family GH114
MRKAASAAIRECRAYSPFVRAGKAVFVAEYRTPRRRFCRRALRLRFSAIFKRLALGRFRRTCPE